MKDNKLFKHLKKTASKSLSRPVLRCVHYSNDGSIVVTDSHRLLKINNFHEHQESFSMDLWTMELSTKNYPDTNRLLPKREDASTTVKISLSALLRATTALKVSSDEIVVLEVKDKIITIKNLHDEKMFGGPLTIDLPVSKDGDDVIIAFNSRYLIDCCNFFLDAKERYAMDDVKFYINNSTRPVLVEIERSNFQYLITPVRVS